MDFRSRPSNREVGAGSTILLLHRSQGAWVSPGGGKIASVYDESSFQKMTVIVPSTDTIEYCDDCRKSCLDRSSRVDCVAPFWPYCGVGCSWSVRRRDCERGDVHGCHLRAAPRIRLRIPTWCCLPRAVPGGRPGGRRRRPVADANRAEASFRTGGNEMADSRHLSDRHRRCVWCAHWPVLLRSEDDH